MSLGAPEAEERQDAAVTQAPAEAAPEQVRERDQRPGLVRVARRLALVVVLIALDLWSKAAVFRWLDPVTGTAELVSNCCERGHQRVMVLGDAVTWFSFMRSENQGAAFGSFAQWPHLLVGGRILAALFLLWLVARVPVRRPWFALALILVLAGALGNLYDNLFREPFGDHPYGSVRDFIDVYFSVWHYHFPTFNVADSCITVGAVLLLLTGLGRDERDGERKGEASPPETAT